MGGTGRFRSCLYEELLQVEKQLDFRAEREGRDKKERDDKKRAFKNLVRHGKQNMNKKPVGVFLR